MPHDKNYQPARVIFAKHYELASGNPCDEMILHCMQYAIDAMEEYKATLSIENSSYSPTIDMNDPMPPRKVFIVSRTPQGMRVVEKMNIQRPRKSMYPLSLVSAVKRYEKDMKLYNDHLDSLKHYQCNPPEFLADKEGQEVELDVDFGIFIAGLKNSPVLFAVPPSQPRDSQGFLKGVEGTVPPNTVPLNELKDFLFNMHEVEGDRMYFTLSNIQQFISKYDGDGPIPPDLLVHDWD